MGSSNDQARVLLFRHPTELIESVIHVVFFILSYAQNKQ
jgi:prolipoprotein diacylglyceryltransferase